jgi:hypothetical protein
MTLRKPAGPPVQTFSLSRAHRVVSNISSIAFLHYRTVFQMNRIAYLLLLLLIWAQCDDYCAAALLLPSTALADDDEYVLSRQRPTEEECSLHPTQESRGLGPQTANFSLLRRDLPSEWNLTTTFTPPSLYVFMSLQI